MAVAASPPNVIPVTHTFIEDCETPVSAFLKLRGDGPAFLLESAEQGQRVGRWSFIGYRPRDVVTWRLEDGGDPYAIAAEAVSASSRVSTLASTVVVCLRWSNATMTSESISAMSGRPTGSGLTAGSRSTARTQS